MIYRECRPSPALRSIVERLWWLEGPAEAIGVEPIPPDGHSEIIVHAGDPFVGWRDDGTMHVQERDVVFENPTHDFPQRVIYRRNADGSVTGHIEGMRNGQMRGVEFPYARCK